MFGVAMMLFIYVVICVGVILLQIFLSKKDSKWPGLILPVITLCIALLAVFSLAAYNSVGTVNVVQVTGENGVIVREAAPAAVTTIEPLYDTPTMVGMVAGVFLLCNIPTIVLLAIYFACRGKLRKRKALERMRAQDLE